jgi:ABC-type glycerol-3-phosphate transport system substrate-binding protein
MSSKALFTYDNFTFALGWNNALRGANPQATLAPIPTLRGKRGARQNHFEGFEAGWAISANAKNPDRIVQLLDWLVTPIGMDTVSWGIEGTHYTLRGTRPAAIEDYSPEGLAKAMDPSARQLLPDVKQRYATKTPPFAAFYSDIGGGLGDLGVLSDFAGTTAWDKPGEQDRWYEMTAADPGLHTEVLEPPLEASEIDRVKKYATAVGAIINPAIDKVVLGQLSLGDYEKAVQDALKAGAGDWEKIYQEAEARVK